MEFFSLLFSHGLQTSLRLYLKEVEGKARKIPLSSALCARRMIAFGISGALAMKAGGTTAPDTGCRSWTRFLWLFDFLKVRSSFWHRSLEKGKGNRTGVVVRVEKRKYRWFSGMIFRIHRMRKSNGNVVMEGRGVSVAWIRKSKEEVIYINGERKILKERGLNCSYK